MNSCNIILYLGGMLVGSQLVDKVIINEKWDERSIQKLKNIKRVVMFATSIAVPFI